MNGLSNHEGSSKYKQSLAEYGMVTFGCGEVIGSIISGLLVDWIGPRKTTQINLTIIVAMTIVTVL